MRQQEEISGAGGPGHASEWCVRDAYARQLRRFRVHERLVAREAGYRFNGCRADMRTVDTGNVLREWEFKLLADASALGQVLRYVALSRRDQRYQRPVLGVLAAFEFADDVYLTNHTMNLGIELVQLPPWLRNAGRLLPVAASMDVPVFRIPPLPPQV